jgi:hypothetical protein
LGLPDSKLYFDHWNDGYLVCPDMVPEVRFCIRKLSSWFLAAVVFNFGVEISHINFNLVSELIVHKCTPVTSVKTLGFISHGLVL